MSDRLQRILLFILIILAPSQLSLHFWPAFSLINSIKVDYLAPTVYFTDLIILAILILDAIKIKKISSSMDSLSPFYYLLLLFAITNILFSFTPLLSLYKFFRLLLYFLLFRFLLSHRQYFIKILPPALSLSLVWVSVLAIWQFIIRHSVGGLWFWLGERPLDLLIPQVAKISIFNFGLYLRSYATLPHPNALAGYLSASLLLLAFFNRKKYYPFLILALSTLFITFSRSVILATLIMLLTYSVNKRKNLYSVFLLFLFVISVVATGLLGNPSSLYERLQLYQKAAQSVIAYPLLGSGLGTFPVISNLDFQPVHNIPLLLLVELGLPLFIIISIVIGKYIIDNWHSLSLLLRLIIIDIFALSLIDHYWLTSYQNILLLTFTTAVIVFGARGYL